MFKTTITTFLLAILMSPVSQGQELAGIKCLINGERQAKTDASAEHRKGMVYFCCDKCARKFKSEMEKSNTTLTTKANHQLLLSGQYTQTACPISGRKIAEGKSVDVGGVTVGVCCAGCVKKIETENDLATKAQLVFSDQAFEKGFAPSQPEINLERATCPLNPGKAVSADVAAEHNGKQVYFCCKNCKAKFEKNPSAYATQANHQLVVTGQFKQIACPFSGSDVNDEISTDVGSVSVNYCCGKCKSKMENASSDQQMEYVFGNKGFPKGFSPNE